MKSLYVLAAVAMMTAGPALAQNQQQKEPFAGAYGTQQGAPGGAQQSSEFRERSAEQTAVEAKRHYRRHPGTLTKFNTGTAGAPEVQFDIDRREAQQSAGRTR